MTELLLIDLAGFRYGVWKKDLLSHKVQTIHWLTDSDGAVTAISMMGVHPVSLADLSFCIGLAPIHKNRACPVLSLADQEISVSFVVQKVAGRFPVSSSAVFPIPSYVRTPFVTTCVLIGSDLIPVINLREIHRCIQDAEFEPPLPALHFPAAQKRHAPSLDLLRGFTCDNTSFAASADTFSPETARVGQITALALTPEFVRGIIFHHNQVLTVIDIGRRMGLPTGAAHTTEKLLFAEIEGQGFAFAVEKDQGALSADGVILKTLPMLARSDWLRTVILRSRQIIPVVDFKALLSEQPVEGDRKSPALKFCSDMRFQKVFGKEEVGIVEFFLLNTVHALPSQEVEDSIPFKFCHPLPDTGMLVAGVAPYEGELLPVLDLAKCFGKKSHPTPQWRLLLVQNGDLRVLIMTESVIRERFLNVNMQRTLPFMFPHSSVYGCYPVANRVRLILNILALTAYFDSERVHELLLFADEMKQQEIPVDTFPKDVGIKFEKIKKKKLPPGTRQVSQEQGEMKEKLLSEKESELKNTISTTDTSSEAHPIIQIDDKQKRAPSIIVIDKHAASDHSEAFKQDHPEHPSKITDAPDQLLKKPAPDPGVPEYFPESSGTPVSIPPALPAETNIVDEIDLYTDRGYVSLTDKQDKLLYSTLAAALRTDDAGSAEAAGNATKNAPENDLEQFEKIEKIEKSEAAEKIARPAAEAPQSRTAADEFKAPASQTDPEEFSVPVSPDPPTETHKADQPTDRQSAGLTDEQDSLLLSTLAATTLQTDDAGSVEVAEDSAEIMPKNLEQVEKIEKIEQSEAAEKTARPAAEAPQSRTAEDEHLIQPAGRDSDQYNDQVEADEKIAAAEFKAPASQTDPEEFSDPAPPDPPAETHEADLRTTRQADGLTEEQDSLLLSTLAATALRPESAEPVESAEDATKNALAAPAGSTSELLKTNGIKPDEADTETRVLPPPTQQDSSESDVRSTTPPSKSAAGLADVEKETGDKIRMPNKNEEVAAASNINSEATEKPEQLSSASDALEQRDKSSPSTQSWSMLENSDAFPELKAFSDQVADVNTTAPPVISQDDELIEKTVFPILAAPDPREIRAQQKKNARKKAEEARKIEKNIDLFNTGKQAADQRPTRRKQRKKFICMYLAAALLLAFLLGLFFWGASLKGTGEQGWLNGKSVKFVNPPQSREPSAVRSEQETTASKTKNTARSSPDTDERTGVTAAQSTSPATYAAPISPNPSTGGQEETKAAISSTPAADPATPVEPLTVVPERKDIAAEKQNAETAGSASPSQAEKTASITQEQNEVAVRKQKGGTVESIESLASVSPSRSEQKTSAAEHAAPISPNPSTGEPGEQGKTEPGRHTPSETNMSETDLTPAFPGQKTRKTTEAEQPVPTDLDVHGQEEIKAVISSTPAADATTSTEIMTVLPGQKPLTTKQELLTEDPEKLREQSIGGPEQIRISEKNDPQTAALTGATSTDSVQKKAEEAAVIGEGMLKSVQTTPPADVPPLKDDMLNRSHHTVNKGDTLWKISERYTGSGFNYHDVARVNKISDPDLIQGKRMTCSITTES
jgi:chemotaxis signal transduction protein/LysM repeat protein